MTSVLEKEVVGYKKYVAGWLDTSIRDFLARIPASRTPQTCLAEAAWGLVGIGLLGLMTVRQQMRRGLEPHNCSVANARDAVRYAMRNSGRLDTRPASFLGALVAAKKDNYVRQRPKRARNYPRKKRENLPDHRTSNRRLPRNRSGQNDFNQKQPPSVNGVGRHAHGSAWACLGLHCMLTQSRRKAVSMSPRLRSKFPDSLADEPRLD